MSEQLNYNIINLDAEAHAEVDQDVISITFASSATGADSRKVQEKLQVATNAALEIMRPLKKGWQVRVETAGFRVTPVYKNGAVSGYGGKSTIVVYGTDMQTISSLVSFIKTMEVESVDFSVSPSKRRSFEEKLALKAIAAFREKAEAYAKAFGGAEDGRFKLVTSTVNVRTGYGRRPIRAASASLMSASAAPAFEAEGGKEELTATVQGSIQLA